MTQGRVIVLDDDQEMRGLLQRYLGENGFAVRTVADGQALDRALAREACDVLVLDLMMPGEDGLAVCRRLRAQNDQTPILMLTARGDPIDRVVGLEMGADDYLPKPFLPRELLARVNALQRRRPVSAVAESLEGSLSFGPFTLDMARMTLTRDGRALDISTREFALLKTLLTRAGRPLSRAQIIDLALGRDADITDRAIDVQIARLRKVIEDDPANPKWIKTVWGHGYVFAKADG